MVVYSATVVSAMLWYTTSQCDTTTGPIRAKFRVSVDRERWLVQLQGFRRNVVPGI